MPTLRGINFFLSPGSQKSYDKNPQFNFEGDIMSIKLKPLDRQVVVVFGASSGMGRAAALKFAQGGAKVVVAARGEAGLQSLVNEIKNAGGQAVYRVADAAKFNQVQSIADLAIQEYGRLDTWVGCAGVWVTSKFEDTKPEEFRQILELNLAKS
jgi:NAD(P)-dependent dehydrogenase (short-subunit alcohol dehydrogenase family)